MNHQQKQLLTDNGIDMAAGLECFMGMEKMYEKYLLKFLEDPTFSTLFDAVDKQEREAARIAAHSLKSITGTLGLTNLQQRVKAAELDFKEGRWEEGAAKIPEIKEEYRRIKNVFEAFKQLRDVP